MKNKYTIFLSGWVEIIATSDEEVKEKIDKITKQFTKMSIDGMEKEEIADEKKEESTSTGPYMEKNPSSFTETFKDSGKEDGIRKMM